MSSWWKDFKNPLSKQWIIHLKDHKYFVKNIVGQPVIMKHKIVASQLASSEFISFLIKWNNVFNLVLAFMIISLKNYCI